MEQYKLLNDFQIKLAKALNISGDVGLTVLVDKSYSSPKEGVEQIRKQLRSTMIDHIMNLLQDYKYKKKVNLKEFCNQLDLNLNLFRIVLFRKGFAKDKNRNVYIGHVNRDSAIELLSNYEKANLYSLPDSFMDYIHTLNGNVETCNHLLLEIEKSQWFLALSEPYKCKVIYIATNVFYNSRTPKKPKKKRISEAVFNVPMDIEKIEKMNVEPKTKELYMKYCEAQKQIGTLTHQLAELQLKFDQLSDIHSSVIASHKLLTEGIEKYYSNFKS